MKVLGLEVCVSNAVYVDVTGKVGNGFYGVTDMAGPINPRVVGCWGVRGWAM